MYLLVAKKPDEYDAAREDVQPRTRATCRSASAPLAVPITMPTGDNSIDNAIDNAMTIARTSNMLKQLATPFAAALLLLGSAASAHAEDYPVRAVHIVVPYAAGGASDIFARLIGQKLTERTKQPVVVENRPGAGGTIGADFVAKSKPDGYTLLLSDDAVYSMASSLYPSLPYKPSDLVPVVYVSRSPLLLITSARSGIASFNDLLAREKAKPGSLNIASSGNGTGSHVALVLLNSIASTRIQHVPYKGGAAALNDVVSGQTEMMFIGTPPAMPFIASKQLRVLAVSSPKRVPGLPDVPTISESGVPGFESVAGQGLFAPAGTPPDVVRWLNEEINRIIATPEVSKRWNDLGAEPTGFTVAQYKSWLESETAKWSKVVREAGVKAD